MADKAEFDAAAPRQQAARRFLSCVGDRPATHATVTGVHLFCGSSLQEVQYTTSKKHFQENEEHSHGVRTQITNSSVLHTHR